MLNSFTRIILQTDWHTREKSRDPRVAAQVLHNDMRTEIVRIWDLGSLKGYPIAQLLENKRPYNTLVKDHSLQEISFRCKSSSKISFKHDGTRINLLDKKIGQRTKNVTLQQRYEVYAMIKKMHQGKKKSLYFCINENIRNIFTEEVIITTNYT